VSPASSARLRIGVDGHTFGPAGATIADQARRAEEAGFDSIWLGDHIVSPLTSSSRYPYTGDGSIPWSPDLEMYDAIVSASYAAASTTSLRIAFGVLVLPLRHPLVLAKQLASLDRLSDGRVVVGAGVGWFAEEFTALGVPYDSRAARFEEWVDILRSCWTGRPERHHGTHYQLDIDTASFPTPVGAMPILVGGSSAEAIGLAGRVADGWYPIVSEPNLTSEWLAPRIAQVRAAAEAVGRDAGQLRFVVYADAPAEVIAARLDELEDEGIEEVVVFVDWTDPGAPDRVNRTLRRAG
jgi:probable F420-dependent oxidoreductase